MKEGKKGIAAIIVAKMKPKRKAMERDEEKDDSMMSEKYSEESEDKMGDLDYASKDVMEALKSEDADSFRDSLKAFVEMCIDKYESEMKDSHNNDEEY
jgi:hypothetical protein